MGANNKILSAMMASINNLLLETRGKTIKLFKGNLKKSYDQHMQIYLSIKSKNANEAGNAMYKHLDKVEELLSKLE